jgi:hypothetical protein
MDEPNEHGVRDASQLSIAATTHRVKIWAIGFTEGAEAVAEELKAALNVENRCPCPLCRSQHNTSESKIRAAALAEAIAVAREIERKGWNSIAMYED